MGLLDEIMAKLDALPPERIAELEKARAADTRVWVPNEGPQLRAVKTEADILFYGGEAGGGKALALDTRLPTPAGWTTMGEVHVGDKLLDERGQPCTVLTVSPVWLGHDCYRVAFSDGSEIVADGDHKWFTITDQERVRQLRATPEWRAKRQAMRPRRGSGKRPDLAARNAASAGAEIEVSAGGIRTTREIAATLTVGKVGRLNHAVPCADALRLPAVDLPIDPYVLGAWLGDGSSYKGEITSADAEVLAEIAAAGHGLTARSGTGISFGVLGLQKPLRLGGLLANKHIPAAYLRASLEQRVALLQGLMDTDGYVDPRGQCEFTSTNEALAFGAKELLVSLGMKASISVGRAMLNGRDCGAKYRIKFVTDLAAFRLPRKLDKQKRDGMRLTTRRRYITAVEPIASVPVKCVGVDSPSHLYLAGDAMIPTHNSDLIVGLSLTEHKRSLVLRRTNKEAGKLVERYVEVLGTRDGWNGQLHVWHTADGRTVEIDGCQHEDDKQKFKGHPRDLMAFDEVSDFSESQFRFITGWNRSADPNQRCRIVCAGNPPTTPEGLWVLEFWGPWLDPAHPRPARDGELRWFTTIAGKDQEVDGPGPHLVDGEWVKARSRTFIRARLSDNPDLARTDYASVLAALPEELRAAYKEGRFDAGLRDHEWQVIPTQWIIAAQKRWTPSPPAGVPMSALAADVAQGGNDQTVLAWRHDWWFAPLVAVPGAQTPMASDVAALVIKHRRDLAAAIIDVGGGYGGGVVERLRENGVEVVPFNGASGAVGRTKDRQFGFANKRAQSVWALREALDPDQQGGSPIAFPDDAALRADLAAYRWKPTARGILIGDKVEMKKEIGRSPDKGDAVVMAWAEGQNAIRKAMRAGGRGRAERPKFANVGYADMKKRR